MFQRIVLGAAPLVLIACNPSDSAPAPGSEPVLSEGMAWATRTGDAPLVIAHRGASGLRPEHTQAAYQLALEQGADVLEPDLMVSSDGVLIVRHDPYLSTSTDVAARPEFADRQQERFGRTDWWVSDFTAQELRSLTARQVFADRDPSYNDQYPVMTFIDFLDYVSAEQIRCGCIIPIEPEVKLPAEHVALGLDPLPLLLADLQTHDLDRADAPVVIQSFDAAFLQRLNQQTDVPLAMLYAGPDAPGYDAGGLSLEEIAAFADGVGAHKAVLITSEGDSTGYLEAAHALGLDIHVWTVRDDRAPITGASVEEELAALYALGVDAVFTDFPATAVAVRAQTPDP